jgi:hypothetical protein
LWDFHQYLRSNSEIVYATLKQASSGCFYVRCYSPFMIIFPSHSTHINSVGETAFLYNQRINTSPVTVSQAVFSSYSFQQKCRISCFEWQYQVIPLAMTVEKESAKICSILIKSAVLNFGANSFWRTWQYCFTTMTYWCCLPHVMHTHHNFTKPSISWLQ